jgi:uncharacterized membrane protein YdjX (TVP38/TMEM64 family)
MNSPIETEMRKADADELYDDPAVSAFVPKKPTAGQIMKDLGPLGPLVIAAGFVPLLGFITLTAVCTSTGLPAWLKAHPYEGVPLYILFFWIAGICCLPTYAYSVLGGWAFGLVLGTVATTIAYLGACIFAFVLARKLAGERVEPLLAHYPKLAAVHRAVRDASFGKTLFVIGLLRISPASPFAMTNIVLGAGGVRFFAFVLGSMIGVLPRTFAVVYVASRLTALSFEFDDANKWIFTVAGIIATVLVVLILSRWAQRELDRQIRSGRAV